MVIQNGIAMFLTFLTIRVIPIPLYWSHAVSVRSNPGYDDIGYLKPILFVPGVVLDSLNIFWFYKIARGVLKGLFGER